MKKYKEYLGVRERLSHWQEQTPGLWNSRGGCFQTQRIPTQPLAGGACFGQCFTRLVYPPTEAVNG